MHQAIQNTRRPGRETPARLKNHLTLIGTMAGELLALASFVAALAAGWVGLAMVLA